MEKCIICGANVINLKAHTTMAHKEQAQAQQAGQSMTVIPVVIAPVVVVEAVVPVAPVEVHVNGFHIFNPEVDPNFIILKDVADELEIALQISKIHPVNVLVTGQPGGGKTSLGMQFAAKYNRPCVVTDMSAMQEPQDLFHTTYLVDGKTDIRESGFVKGMETPNCVVVLDELNRPENERVLNPILPLLDGRRSTYIEYLRRLVRVADGVIFIATLNEGVMFCGVSSIDTALRDRFRELHMPYLPPGMERDVIAAKTGVSEEIATMLANFTAKVRRSETIDIKVSTRQILTAAENFAHGDMLWRAVSTCIGHFNDISWREKVMEILSVSISIEELGKWQAAKAQSKAEDSYARYHKAN